MRRSLTVRTSGRGLLDVTERVRAVVRESGVVSGFCVVFARHTSASLLLFEDADPSARRDLERFFDRIAPDGDPAHEHDAEGPDDMPAHVRTALTRTSELLLVDDGELVLGTWQGLFLFEHRLAPHARTLEVLVAEA